MKRKFCLSLIIIIVCGVIIIPPVARMNNYLTADAETIQLPLNTKMTVSVSGFGKLFTVNISDTKYYVVETRGNIATNLAVIGLSSGTITDTNGSGVGDNACIGFVGEIGTITIWLTGTGTTEIQIRKQRAVFYGFDYSINNPDDEVDTSEDVNAPYNALNSLYYSAKYTGYNTSASHISTVDYRGYSRYNSEIVFFSGHGEKDNEYDSYGLAIFFPNISDSLFTISGIWHMENTKLAVWAACCSSNSNNTTNTSFAEKSITEGAKTSIGWPDTISANSSKKFTDKLFEELGTGATVENAAMEAEDEIFWWFDNVLDYEIFGDEDLMLTLATSYRYNSIIVNTALIDEFSQRTSVGDWEYININETTRVYKIINGMLTNDYYTIRKMDDKIVSIKHSGYKIKEQEKYPINEIRRKVPEFIDTDGLIFNNLSEIETQKVYCLINDVIVPIEINYCTYTTNNGFAYVNTLCYDMTNGNIIDYKDISFRS